MNEIDVLCINCENMISVEKLSIHSSVCITPTTYILKLSSYDPIKLVDFRIDKLKCSIEAILHEEIKILTSDEKALFNFLSQQSAESLTIKDSTNASLDICIKIKNRISSYPVQNISPCVSLYLERVKVIITEKAKLINEDLRFKESTLPMQTILENKATQLDLLNKQIIKYKQSTEEIDTKGICLEVNSNVEDWRSRKSISSSLTSPKDSNQVDLEDLDKMHEVQEKEMEKRSNEDLQKYFYSKCLIMKLKYSSRDLAQFIQIPDLYRRVKDSGIPVEMWEDFIAEQFKKPEFWIKSKK